MTDRTPAEVSADQLRIVADEALERRREDLRERNEPITLLRARDFLTRPQNRAVLQEMAVSLARRDVNGFTSGAWSRLAHALADPDLEEAHGIR